MTTPKISVCMPMFNASRYLRECIDSILAQTFTDFELLIADDGSSDNSVEIVESYTDPRIRLIRRPHDYIATLNCLLSEARGEYIARMDADDVMLPNRLQLQVDYMDANPEVDVLGGGIIVFGDGLESQLNCIETVSMIEMIDSCALAHPTVMMRRSTLKKNSWRYNRDYAYAEDYELWIRMLKSGACIHNLSEPLIRYRRSSDQISAIHSSLQKDLTYKIKREAVEWLVKKTYEILEEPVETKNSSSLLSVIIPFLNEGDEVVNTVRSVRETTGQDVEIVVINDCSTDKRNYEEELKPFGVKYYTNKIRLGAALSKERGVKLCSAPFFIILDSHMRCLTPDWHKILIKKLTNNPNRLLCCDSVPIVKQHDGTISISQSMVPCQAAFLTFREGSLLPGIRWFAKREDSIAGIPTDAICAVLGACYCSSTTYWNSITGMYGLMHFGCEEPCVSLKAWLDGGGCYFVPEVKLGHIYRTENAFYISRKAFVYNHLAISKMLMPVADQCLVHALAQRTNTASYDVAALYLQANHKYLTSIRTQFEDLITERYGHIVDINANASWLHYNKKEEIDEVLQSVHNKLLKSEPKSGGLLDGGASGILLYLLAYSELFPSVDESKLMISSLIDYLYDVIEQGKCNYSLWNGYAGIGWALLYILSNNLIDDNMEEVLCKIDQKISEWAPANISDHSFHYGLGGIYCYVVNRIAYCKKHNLANGFNKSFLNSLEEVAHSLLDLSVEYRSTTYAMQYLKSSKCADFCFDAMRPMDIVKPIRFIPENHKLWKLDYQNVLGFAFEMIYLNTKRLYYEKESL